MVTSIKVIAPPPNGSSRIFAGILNTANAGAPDRSENNSQVHR
jgi:hypothetical protein